MNFIRLKDSSPYTRKARIIDIDEGFNRRKSRSNGAKPVNRNKVVDKPNVISLRPEPVRREKKETRFISRRPEPVIKVKKEKRFVSRKPEPVARGKKDSRFISRKPDNVKVIPKPVPSYGWNKDLPPSTLKKVDRDLPPPPKTFVEEFSSTGKNPVVVEDISTGENLLVTPPKTASFFSGNKIITIIIIMFILGMILKKAK